MQWPKRLHREEEGHSLVLFAVFAPVLFGAMALVLDVGLLLMNQAALQNAADAAALAGASYLPVAPSSATSAAIQYASANGVTVSVSDISIITQYATNDTIFVRPQRTVTFQFAPVVGVMSAQGEGRAKAATGTLAGSTGVMPWGLVDTNYDPAVFGYPYGQSVTIILWDNTTTDANFQALSIDGTGASPYRSSIANGTTSYVGIGDIVDTEPGVAHGPTKQGLEDRIGSNSQSYSDVVAPNGDGTYRVLDWQSPRIAIVPVITGLVHPGSQAQVMAFSVFFIESWQLHGGQVEVTGRFIDTVVPGGSWTPYQGSYGARVVHLLE